MQKKIWIPLLLVVAILAGLGIYIADRNAPSADIPGVEYTLFVNGRNVKAATAVYKSYDDGYYVEIPLITVMKELGADVEWMSDTTAAIEFNGKRYILDTHNDTLYEEGDNKWNGIFPAPGGSLELHARLDDGEYVIDNHHISSFFIEIGVDFRIDNSGSKVYIDFIKE